MEQDQFQSLVLDMIREIKEEIRGLRNEMSTMREELKGEIRDVRAGMNDRFDRTDKRIDGMEEEMKKDRSKLEDVYQARNKVKITFGWQWSLISLLIAIAASGITQVFGG